MELWALIVNGLILLATVATAIVANRQASLARDARDDARKASTAAEAHEAAALTAAERSAVSQESSARAQAESALHHQRSADALEKQLAFAEEQAKPRTPWEFERVTETDGDQLWRVTNRTGENLTSVTIDTPAGYDEQWIKPMNTEPVDLAPDASIEFQFLRRYSSPPSRTVWVMWVPAAGTKMEKYTTTVR